MDTEKPRLLDVHRADLFLRCGEWYWRNSTPYLGARRTTPALALERAVRTAAEYYLRGRVAREERPAGDILRTAQDAFDREMSECAVDASAEAIDRAAWAISGATGAWLLECGGKTHAIRTRAPKIFIKERGLIIQGAPAYFTEHGPVEIVVGREPDARRSRLLTGLGVLYHEETGKWPRAVGYDLVTEDAVGWTAHTKWARRERRDYEYYMDVSRRIVDAIKGGERLPVADCATWCSQGSCPHYRDCAPATRAKEAPAPERTKHADAV